MESPFTRADCQKPCEVLDRSGFLRTNRKLFRTAFLASYALFVRFSPLIGLLRHFAAFALLLPGFSYRAIQTGLGISINTCSISNCSDRCLPTACTPSARSRDDPPRKNAPRFSPTLA